MLQNDHTGSFRAKYRLDGLPESMKFADNTGLAEQSVTTPGGETGQMNTAESISAGSALVVQAEQPAPAFEVERDDLTTFFTIGIVINLVMITAYFVWAFKQWKKAGTRGE